MKITEIEWQMKTGENVVIFSNISKKFTQSKRSNNDINNPSTIVLCVSFLHIDFILFP